MGESTAALVEECRAWVVAHQALSRLAKERAAADAEEGRWLLAALRAAAHVHLGFGSFGEYIERCFGYQWRTTQEKLRVAEALKELPLLARELERGALHWSAVRELTRVAAPETEQQWLDVSRGKSVRQLEELVAGKHRGDSPGSPHNPAARRHVLRFEVAPETFALFREAMSALRRSTSGTLDDDSALLAMARQVLGGPRDEGRSGYQIAITVCEACGRGQQVGCGALVPVGSDIVAMAQCDGQQLGRISPDAANDNVSTSLPSVGSHASGDAHVRQRVQDSIRAHVGAPVDAGSAGGGTRARQTIPPALRRSVLLRDHRRCHVPGCRNAAFLDVHHLQLRAEGGRNAADNLLALCGTHHRAAHRGRLLIEGNSATTARFRHADGNDYGQVVDPQALDTQAKTFSALRNLGFREAEVRAALAQLRNDGELAGATLEQWLRAALARLRRPHARVPL